MGSDPGETPLFYQWRFNNEPIAAASGSCGGTGCSVSRDVLGQCANAGNYSVVFWNQYGQVSTWNCELSVSGQDAVAVVPPAVQVTSANQAVTLTATTCLGDVELGRNCVQWYLTRGSQKTAIPGANSLAYTIPTPITCDKLGVYTVSVADRAWNAYEASATVSAGSTGAAVSITSTRLQITPDNVGNGTWVYQWYSSADGVNFAPIAGAATQSLTLAAADPWGYYKGVGRRPGGTAVVIAWYDPFTPGVTVRATLNANLDVTYAAQASGAVWTYQWYFTPAGGGVEQLIVGANTSEYLVPAVGCAQKGAYRVEVNCSDGSASASLGMQSTYGISFTTLHITPDNVGTGDWVYQWYVSDNAGGPWTTIAGETERSLPLFVDLSNDTQRVL